ncbi:MAG: hypothetical protein ACWA41_05520 [Putridiphycobacter sp.]
MFRIFTVFIILISTATAIGQTYADSVLLLNGKSYKCDIIGMEGPSLHFKFAKSNGKVEDYFIADYRILTYVKDGKETPVYKQDEEIGDFLTFDESKRYAIGAYDARETYKPRYVFYSSLALGLGLSLWDTYLSQSAINNSEFLNPDASPGLFKKSPTLLPFAAPVLMSVSFGLPNMRVKQKYILHESGYGDKIYYTGFNSYAKQKRALSALKGGFIGIGMGLIFYAINQ